MAGGPGPPLGSGRDHGRIAHPPSAKNPAKGKAQSQPRNMYEIATTKSDKVVLPEPRALPLPRIVTVRSPCRREAGSPAPRGSYRERRLRSPAVGVLPVIPNVQHTQNKPKLRQKSGRIRQILPLVHVTPRFDSGRESTSSPVLGLGTEVKKPGAQGTPVEIREKTTPVNRSLTKPKVSGKGRKLLESLSNGPLPTSVIPSPEFFLRAYTIPTSVPALHLKGPSNTFEPLPDISPTKEKHGTDVAIKVKTTPRLPPIEVQERSPSTSKSSPVPITDWSTGPEVDGHDLPPPGPVFGHVDAMAGPAKTSSQTTVCWSNSLQEEAKVEQLEKNSSAWYDDPAGNHGDIVDSPSAVCWAEPTYNSGSPSEENANDSPVPSVGRSPSPLIYEASENEGSNFGQLQNNAESGETNRENENSVSRGPSPGSTPEERRLPSAGDDLPTKTQGVDSNRENDEAKVGEEKSANGTPSPDIASSRPEDRPLPPAAESLEIGTVIVDSSQENNTESVESKPDSPKPNLDRQSLTPSIASKPEDSPLPSAGEDSSVIIEIAESDLDSSTESVEPKTDSPKPSLDRRSLTPSIASKLDDSPLPSAGEDSEAIVEIAYSNPESIREPDEPDSPNSSDAKRSLSSIASKAEDCPLPSAREGPEIVTQSVTSYSEKYAESCEPKTDSLKPSLVVRSLSDAIASGSEVRLPSAREGAVRVTSNSENNAESDQQKTDSPKTSPVVQSLSDAIDDSPLPSAREGPEIVTECVTSYSENDAESYARKPSLVVPNLSDSIASGSEGSPLPSARENPEVVTECVTSCSENYAESHDTKTDSLKPSLAVRSRSDAIASRSEVSRLSSTEEDPESDINIENNADETEREKECPSRSKDSHLPSAQEDVETEAEIVDSKPVRNDSPNPSPLTRSLSYVVAGVEGKSVPSAEERPKSNCVEIEVSEADTSTTGAAEWQRGYGNNTIPSLLNAADDSPQVIEARRSVDATGPAKDSTSGDLHSQEVGDVEDVDQQQKGEDQQLVQAVHQVGPEAGDVPIKEVWPKVLYHKTPRPEYLYETPENIAEVPGFDEDSWGSPKWPRKELKRDSVTEMLMARPGRYASLIPPVRTREELTKQRPGSPYPTGHEPAFDHGHRHVFAKMAAGVKRKRHKFRLLPPLRGNPYVGAYTCSDRKELYDLETKPTKYGYTVLFPLKR